MRARRVGYPSTAATSTSCPSTDTWYPHDAAPLMTRRRYVSPAATLMTGARPTGGPPSGPSAKPAPLMVVP